jgi:ABC-2 type transport system permease protein
MKEWFNLQAMYVLWLREMKRYVRARSRIIGSLGMPFFFLIFLGTGFKSFRPASIPDHIDYLNFLAPGMLAVVLQFGSMFTGMAILWDRQFGFLKEIMVAPVSRVAIVLGRTLGGVTTALVQGLLFIAVALLAGLKLSGLSGFLLTPLFMIFITGAFVNLGLAIASLMRDMQGFSIVMNFIMVPLLLLSGAMFPIEQFPRWVQALAYLDPLFYGVDGLRYSLIGMSRFPPLVDAAVLFLFCAGMVGLGAFLFSRVDVD